MSVIYCVKCHQRKPKKGSRYNWQPARFNWKGFRDGMICRDCTHVKLS